MSTNDIDILDSSAIVEKIIAGQVLPEYAYKVNEKPYNLCYYLVDGIYPNWAIFVDTVAEAIKKKQRTF